MRKWTQLNLYPEKKKEASLKEDVHQMRAIVAQVRSALFVKTTKYIY